ncbi:MAG: cytochrome b/b6 domain-containing protein [Anaerolineales bacterium]
MAGKTPRRAPAKAVKTPTREPVRRYVRFSLVDRVEHLLVLLSFTTLAITGLVQKFALNAVSIAIVRFWGGIENVRTTHHAAATVLMVIVVFHLIELGYKAFVLRVRLTMLPSFQDAKDAWTAFAYNVGLSKKRPQVGRYGFDEKAEYWAFVWGILIMAVTGFMMWNPVTTVRLLPGDFIPAAKTAHGAEAVLAVLAIIVWHMYGVHLKRFNESMWTGKLTEEEMLHEHPLELADIKAGLARPTVPAKDLRRRRLIYYPVAGIVGAALLFGIYGFVSGEKTAIRTVPPQIPTVQVYSPQTPTPLPPTPTLAPSPTAGPTAAVTPGAAGAVTWAEVAPVFAAQCGTCHSATVATYGLSLETYADAMKGGQDGPVIVPGDSAGSVLVQVQSQGGHPGQLTPQELELVRTWIDSGAPEK